MRYHTRILARHEKSRLLLVRLRCSDSWSSHVSSTVLFEIPIGNNFTNFYYCLSWSTEK